MRKEPIIWHSFASWQRLSASGSIEIWIDGHSPINPSSSKSQYRTAQFLAFRIPQDEARMNVLWYIGGTISWSWRDTRKH
jgi:hypothetical protein